MSTIALKLIVGSSLGSLQLEDADAGFGSCKLSSFLIHTSCIIRIDFYFVFMDTIQGYGYGKGDIIVNITVYIPKTLNKEEKELVKKFKECENFLADKATKKSLFDSIKNLFNK